MLHIFAAKKEYIQDINNTGADPCPNNHLLKVFANQIWARNPVHQCFNNQYIILCAKSKCSEVFFSKCVEQIKIPDSQ